MDISHLKILAPVGSFIVLEAAIKAGADEVYFGATALSMRQGSGNNFAPSEFAELAERCHQNGVKANLTLNSMLYGEDLATAFALIDEAKKTNIDAVIAVDMAVIQYANKAGVEVHMSVQTGIANIDSVRFYSQFADRIVLAREVNIAQQAEIVRQIKAQNINGPKGRLVEIEVFAHGALCVSISGKCGMSLLSTNKSANRGQCTQPCRHAYTVTDKETGQQFDVDNEYVMSSADLCTLGFLDEIAASGIQVLKIEGRQKPAEYVDTVVRTYRQALNAIAKNEFTQTAINTWLDQLKTVYNRGLGSGYYLGKTFKEWSGVAGSRATTTKIYLGSVQHVFEKAGVVEVLVHAGTLSLSDELIIVGDKTGLVKITISELRDADQKPVKTIEKGNACTFPVPELCRENDKVYLIQPTGFLI